jgi:hypothetical protein
VQELGPPELGRHDLVQLSEGVLAADEEVDGERSPRSASA